MPEPTTCTHIVITSSRRSGWPSSCRAPPPMRSSARPARSASMSSRARWWRMEARSGGEFRFADGGRPRLGRARSQGLCRQTLAMVGVHWDRTVLRRYLGVSVIALVFPEPRFLNRRHHLWALAGAGGQAWSAPWLHYFFLPPLYNPDIADPPELVALSSSPSSLEPRAI